MELDATFIVSIISFIFFVLIMNQILYKPILAIIEKREKYFDDNKNQTLKNNEEKDSIENEYETKLSDAHKTSREITSLGFQNAKSKKDEIIKNAKDSMNDEIKKRLQVVEEEKNKAQDELNNKTDEISELIASKLMNGGDNV